MKVFYLLTLASLVAAAPQRSYDDVQILRYNNDNRGDGQYRYGYKQSDGQRQESQGEIRNPGTDNEYLAVRGVYAWIAPNGVRYTVTYVADDQGFQPEIEEGGPGAPRHSPPSRLPPHPSTRPPPTSPPTPPTFTTPTPPTRPPPHPSTRPPPPSPPSPPTFTTPTPPITYVTNLSYAHLVASCLG